MRGFHLSARTLAGMAPGSTLLALHAALTLTKGEDGYWYAEGEETKYSSDVLSYWRIAWTLEPVR